MGTMGTQQIDRFDDPVWVKEYEYRVGKSIVVPLLAQRLQINLAGRRILDLGCGSGGVLLACAEAGGICIGIDQDESRIVVARSSKPARGHPPRFLVGDIGNTLPVEGSFDLVLLLEVIEHLPDFGSVEIVLRAAGQLVSETRGKILVSFPPHRSPFGGHQAGWSIPTYLPWIHLLPRSVLRRLAPANYIEYIEAELNQITIQQFEECAIRSGLEVKNRDLYLLRPEYSTRYGFPAIRQLPLLQRVPLLLELFTTGAFYLLGQGDEQI